MAHLLFITQISDPAPNVIHKIESRGYSIRAITSCKFPNTLTRGMLQELSSGRNAMMVTFGDTVRATADSIDIGVDYSCGEVCNGFGILRLSKQSGRWHGRLITLPVS